MLGFRSFEEDRAARLWRESAAMKTAAPAAPSLTLAQVRALWWQKQALGDVARAGDLADVIGRSGWLRTLGGSDVYLAARARWPGLTRAELDAAVEAGALRVVPAARGCIYLVPGHIVADLMALNAEGWRKTTERELAKVGASMKLVEALAEGVVEALARPLTTDALRKAMPAGAIPSFGDAGKKIGLSSPLPLALRLLELDGRAERALEGGRLDTERYLWRRTKPAARARRAGGEPLDAMVGAFLGFAAPVTLAEISAWSGRAQRELAPALERLGAERVAVEEVGEAWALPGDLEAARKAAPPRGLTLLAFEDNYLALHGTGVVSDPRHHALQIDLWGAGKPGSIGAARHVLSRTVVVDGMVAGFWEVDPRSGGGVWMTFDPAPPALARRIDEATGEAARFLLDELGHARVFSLDTMESVQERADRIAKLRGGGAATRAGKAIAAKQVRAPKAKAKPAKAKPAKAKAKAAKAKPAKAKPAKPAKKKTR